MIVQSGSEDHCSRAWSRFESGDFAGAVRDFSDIVDTLAIQSSEFGVLVELLTDRGDFAVAADLIQQKLDTVPLRETGEQSARIDWQVERLRLLARAGERAIAFRVGLDVLEDIASVESADLWQRAQSEGWIGEVEALAATPHDLLGALEFQALAPEATGIPVAIVQRVEEIGHSNATDATLAREAETLLHALGATSAAYRVERSKRLARDAHARSGAKSTNRDRPVLGLSIVVAGGHPALRALIAKSLMKDGAKSVRAVPSAKEASRVGRDVQAILAGSDVAIILARQIAHSTSDQVRTAASKLGIPVLTAESSGSAGVRRAIERWKST